MRERGRERHFVVSKFINAFCHTLWIKAGTPIICFSTGGLKDSVEEWDAVKKTGNGCLFEVQLDPDFSCCIGTNHMPFAKPWSPLPSPTDPRYTRHDLFDGPRSQSLPEPFRIFSHSVPPPPPSLPQMLDLISHWKGECLQLRHRLQRRLQGLSPQVPPPQIQNPCPCTYQPPTLFFKKQPLFLNSGG